MYCVVLFRVNGGKVKALMSDGEIQEFPHFDAALSHVKGESMFAQLIDSGQADYQIVTLDEI